MKGFPTKLKPERTAMETSCVCQNSDKSPKSVAPAGARFVASIVELCRSPFDKTFLRKRLEVSTESGL